MKHTNQKMEIQKKHYLKSLASWTKDLDKKISHLKRTIAEKEVKKDKLVGEIESSNREIHLRSAEINKGIDNLKMIYESKEQERQSLEEAIRRRTEILNESSLKLRDLESQITMMELNLQMQESNYQMKVDRRDAIKKHLEDLKASEQTLRMTDNDDGDVRVGLIDELIKKSVFLMEDHTEQGTLIDQSNQYSNEDTVY